MLTDNRFAELLTQFAYKKQICWIADEICVGESRFASSAKKLLTCWFAELLIELVLIHAFVEFSYERQICWIADTICLQATDLLNCWHDLLRDDKFAEFLTKLFHQMGIETSTDVSSNLLKKLSFGVYRKSHKCSCKYFLNIYLKMA